MYLKEMDFNELSDSSFDGNIPAISEATVFTDTFIKNTYGRGKRFLVDE